MDLIEELRGYELQDREFLDDISTSVNKRAADEIEQLRQRVAELEKDAARYRWLQAQHWSEGVVAVTKPEYVDLGRQTYSGMCLDEFIDAAMQKESGE